MNLSIDTQISMGGIGRFVENIQSIMSESIHELGLEFMNRETELISERIYEQPESPVYQRTGRALRGRIMDSSALRDGTVTISDDTRKVGATRNYLPYLNRNSRYPRLNTEYREDSLAYIEEIANSVVSHNIKRYTA